MSPHDPARLDRYLDGLMETDERRDFERDPDPSLREQADLQRRIDAGLRRLMGAAPEVVVLRRTWRPAWIAAAAAVVLVATLVGWFASRGTGGPDPLEAEYRRIVAQGFVPAVVCTDDATFRQWVFDKFNEPLQPKPDRGSVQYVGWSASRVLSTYSGLLLARVDDAPAVVLIDRASAEDQRLPGPSDPALHQYRRVVGGLVLYEITPLDHPAVLDSLMKP